MFTRYLSTKLIVIPHNRQNNAKLNQFHNIPLNLHKTRYYTMHSYKFRNDQNRLQQVPQDQNRLQEVTNRSRLQQATIYNRLNQQNIDVTPLQDQPLSNSINYTPHMLHLSRYITQCSELYTCTISNIQHTEYKYILG